MKTFKETIKAILPEKLNRKIGSILHCQDYLLNKSLQKAVKAQGLDHLYAALSNIVPDLRFQYSLTEVGNGWFNTKVRAHHSFQISLVQKSCSLLKIRPQSGFTIVDIGDSAGTHLQYLLALYPGIKALSVNLDGNAVEKIKRKGLDAIKARAEELQKYDINADMFLAFELLEHLPNPVEFLHRLSEGTECKALVVTVPYIAQSRVGLHHIRRNFAKEVFAENTHISEWSPEDWNLIFAHSGWKILFTRKYLQYPRFGIFRFMKERWKKIDFEGSYGAILVRDTSWSRLYKDWE